jgi:hypothetical protein
MILDAVELPRPFGAVELYCWSQVLLFFESSQVYDVVSVVLVVSRRNQVQDL